MLNVVAGILKDDVEVKKSKAGKDYVDVRLDVITNDKDANGNVKSIPVRVLAYGKEAKELATYQKGESVHFVGEVMQRQESRAGLEKPISTIGFKVAVIDKEKKLLKEQNEILKGFIKKAREMAEPEVQKDGDSLDLSNMEMKM